MYNEDLKRRFINEKIANKAHLPAVITLFDACAKHEEKWGADLCTVDLDKLRIMVDDVTGLRMKGKWVMINYIRSYVKWCIAVGVDGACGNIFEIRDLGLKKVMDHMVSSPSHLQRCLDDVFSPEDDDTVENTYRCYFWLAFMGLNEVDAFRVKTSDVDMYNKVVVYNNERLEMPRESWRAFEKSINLRSFRRPISTKPFARVVERAESDEILRGSGKSELWASVRPEISRRVRAAYENKKTGTLISYKRVQLSGIFYDMYRVELAGFEVNFRLIPGVHGNKLLADEYMEDYLRWKAAFY